MKCATFSRASSRMYSVQWLTLGDTEKEHRDYLAAYDCHGMLGFFDFGCLRYAVGIRSLGHPFWTDVSQFKDEVVHLIFSKNRFTEAECSVLWCKATLDPSFFKTLNENIMTGKKDRLFDDVERPLKRRRNVISDAGNRTLAVRVKAEYPNH